MAVTKEFNAAQTAVAGLKWNGENIDEYVDALAGLSEAQADAILQTTRLEDSERKAVLSKFKLIDVTKDQRVADAALVAGMDKQVFMTKMGMDATEKYTKEQLKSALVANGFTKAQQKQITAILMGKTAVTGLSTSFKTLAMNTKLAFQAFITSPIGIITAITTVISVITSVIQKIKEAREEAQRLAKEAAESYAEAASEISDYSEQIRALREEIDSNTLSEQEAYDKRKQLLKIQEALIEKYGKEAEGINLVTGAIEGQIEALGRLSKGKWEEFRRENYDAIQDAIKFFTDFSPQDLDWWTNTDTLTVDPVSSGKLWEGIKAKDLDITPGDFHDEFQKAFEEAGLEIEIPIAGITGTFGADVDLSSAEEYVEYYEKLYDIVEDLGKQYFGDDYNEYVGDTLKVYQNEITEINRAIENSQSTFDTYMDGVLRYEQEYSNIYGRMDQALLDYNEALAKNDYSAMAQAVSTMETLETEWTNANWGSEAANKFVRDFLDKFEEQVKTERLKIDVEAEINGIDTGDTLDGVRDSLKSFIDEQGTIDVPEILNFGTTVDAKGDTNTDWNQQELAYITLKNAAEQYGVEVETLLNMLVELGVVTQRMTADTLFGAVNVAPVQDVAAKVSEIYEVITKGQADMVSTGTVSADTIKALAGVTDDYTKYLYEEEGVIRLNIDALNDLANTQVGGQNAKLYEDIKLREQQNEILQEELEYYQEMLAMGDTSEPWSEHIAENTVKIEENNAAIEKNLALQQQYEAIKNPWVETLSVFDGYTSAIETLADFQKTIADGFKISAEEARKFAAVYPEILENATVAADGQVVLNEGIVNGFIEGKRAELNAQLESQIQQLEAEKAVLEGRVEAAQARLDVAMGVANAEGKIAKDTAQYQNDVNNALTKAFIDNGIDEANANKLANAAMAENEEEFARIAKEVFQNMDDNSAKAAYNMAHNIFVNAKNSSTSISGIAKQAHETAKAINAMGEGEIAGSTNLQSTGKDGLYGSKADINLYDGTFNGTEYEYEGNTLDLDDYTAQLKLDIDSYNAAIEDIDRQITLLQSLMNTPLKGFGTSGGNKSSGSSSSTNKVEEYIADIDQYREALERLAKAQAAISGIEREMENTDDLKLRILLEKRLINAYENEQEALVNLNRQRSATISAGAQSLRELGFAVEYNAETNKFWISNMEHLNELTATSKGEYKTLQEATNAMRKETEELINSLTDLNDSNKEGNETWLDVRDSMAEAREEISSLLDEIVQQASESVDSIQSVYDTLHDAADEYAASGYITVDTLQSIIDLGVEYLTYLRDENGQLVINEDRIRDVIAARTEQLAIETSLSYIEALRLAQEDNDIVKLNELLYATQEATEATWGFVYANLQLLGLSGEQYNAALSNINSLRALADNAIHSIGQVGNSVTDELEGMQDGLNDILEYVMDMLRHRIEQQIEALEDMKDAYSEIIELKKESLEASKEEADYQKTVSSKVKEIAKLQAQIDALSLDDSREAQAERAALMEEMAGLQEDLAETQADKTLETQTDALDKMEQEYHDEKDKEIQILEDSISSQQKLYDMAIAYIESNWNTLYSELISWNTQYGDALNSEITTAWDNCLAAARRYGDYVSALNSIQGDIDSAGSSGTNLTVGGSYGKQDSYSNLEMITAIVNQMKRLGQQWDATANTPAKNNQLHQQAVALAARLPQYGVEP